MKIKLEVSELVAKCLQRMIVNEIDNQERWYEEDFDLGIAHQTHDTRESIIKEMRELADDLEKQGINKHIKCY